MSGFPAWLETEGAVKALFRLYGFSVESVSIAGRQIDMIATRHDSFGLDPERWAVEITLERVDATKGSKDFQKLALAETRHPGTRKMIISTAGFTEDQLATLRDLRVVAKTYADFEDSQLNLRQYAEAKLAELETQKAPDIGYAHASFIEPELSIQPSVGQTKQVGAEEWARQLISVPTPGVCALLGNLGSGKTSLLQHVLHIGCKQFLSAPSTSPVPLYVPLGKYKQHSGDIEQMLLSEFRAVGQSTYPYGLIRHFIETRRVILLLDGLDEVHPIQNSDDVLDTVTKIIGALGKKAAAVITCRRQFLESTKDELAYFGPYTAQHLGDLQAGLARALRSHPTTYIASIKPFDRERIEQYLQKRCQMDPAAVSELFGKFYGFADMAQTPVLLAMIATTAEEGLITADADGEFPLLRLYEAYTNRWLERDVGRTRLSKDQRRQLSHVLADHMLWQQVDSETWSYLREVLRKSPEWTSAPLTEEEVDTDIRNSGFLVRDLDDRYRFIHRSIMEYFAARRSWLASRRVTGRDIFQPTGFERS